MHARHAFRQFHEALTRGEVRAAEKQDGQWRVNAWVKQGILLGFRLGDLEESGSGPLSFVDKDTFPAVDSAWQTVFALCPVDRRSAAALILLRA